MIASAVNVGVGAHYPELQFFMQKKCTKNVDNGIKI